MKGLRLGKPPLSYPYLAKMQKREQVLFLETRGFLFCKNNIWPSYWPGAKGCGKAKFSIIYDIDNSFNGWEIKV